MNGLLIAATMLVAPLPEWTYVGADTSNSVWHILTSDWLKGHSRSRSAKMWVQIDGSRDSTVPWQTSKTLYIVDCVNVQYRYEQGAYFYRDGSFKMVGRDYDLKYPTPGSILEAAVEMLCEDAEPETTA